MAVEERTGDRGDGVEYVVIARADGTVIHSGEGYRERGAGAFIVGTSYTREVIHAQVGGSLQTYLPNVGGVIVAACLRLESNPDAPHVILPGTGEQIERSGDLLAAQQTPVPTFIKRGPNQWEYVGHYRVARATSDPSEIKGHAEKSGRDDITQVIFMELVILG